MKLSRRQLLLSAGALSLTAGLPNKPTNLKSTDHPSRLIFFYTPNGAVMNDWRPTGTEGNFTLSPMLSPLQPFKDRLLILDEVDNLVALNGPVGGGHQRGMGSLLNGMTVPPGPFSKVGYAAGPSIDQHLAQTVGGSTYFRSLELAVQPRGSMPWARLSSAGPNEPMPPFEAPWDALDALFGDPSPQSALAVLERSRKELDLVASGYGGKDVDRLRYHQRSIDEIERRIQLSVPPLVAPLPNNLDRTIDLDARENLAAIGKMHMDVLIAAIANDRTRIASLQWAKASGDPTYPWLGFPEPHHELSHRDLSDMVAQDKLRLIGNWYASQIAYLANALAKIPEGSGTILDHTVIAWVSEISVGNVHDHHNLPIMLIGGANGQMRTNRYLKMGHVSHTGLLVTLANMMGSPITKFGEDKYQVGAFNLG